MLQESLVLKTQHALYTFSSTLLDYFIKMSKDAYKKKWNQNLILSTTIIS